MLKYGTSNVDKLFYGEHQIKKAYIGSNLVYGIEEPPVPDTPYIRGGAGAYIDTGITADDTVKVIVWARNFNPMSGYLFGCRYDNYTETFAIEASSGRRTGNIRVAYGTHTVLTATYAVDAFESMSHYHKYEFFGGVLKVDDVVIANASTVATSTAFTHNLNIHLFGANTNGTHTPLDYLADICKCEIYKNGVKVRDYAPTNTPSAGLYDSVSETLFTNDGTGSFTYGTFKETAYTPLPYILCANNQWFDTGVYGTKDLPIVIKFRPTNTTARYAGLFGEYASSSSTYCCFSLGMETAGQDNSRLSFRLGTSDTNAALYNNASNRLTGTDVIVTKVSDTAYAYRNQTQLGSGTRSTSSSFSTTETLVVGGTRDNGTIFRDDKFEGRIYFVGLGSQKNFVPAKKGSKVGMYDTYNDVFKPSASGTPFVEDSQ